MSTDKANRITDFFQSTRKPTNTSSISRKRKLLFADELSTPSPQKKDCTDQSTPSLERLTVKTPKTVASTPARNSLRFIRRPQTEPAIKQLPQSLVRSPLKSPIKSPRKGTPSARRSLFGEGSTEALTSLWLPRKYELLQETFEYMDRSLVLITGKNQLPAFDRVKSSVELMSKRCFNEKKLMQIKTVYPESIDLKYEMALGNKQERSQLVPTLTITPTCQCPEDRSLVKVSLVPKILTNRKQEMHRKLVEITKIHHETFLKSLDNFPPVDKSKLVRWDDRFPLEEVPDIEPDESLMPVNPAKKMDNSIDVVLQRIGKMAAKSVPSPKSKPATPRSAIKADKNGKVMGGELSGLKIDFVMKIRAKEDEARVKQMTRSPETERKIWVLQQSIPLVRTIRSFFVGEKRAVLSKELVLKKIIDSSDLSISREDAEDRLTHLVQVVPSWIVILNKTHVKILDKDMSISTLEKTIEAEISRLMNDDGT